MRDSGFFSRARTQTATLWERIGVDASGDPQFASDSPRQISVRWERRTEVYFTSSGEERQSRAVVYVGEDIVEKSYLYLGTSAAADPSVLTEAFPVSGFQKIPSLDGQDFLRKVYL